MDKNFYEALASLSALFAEGEKSFCKERDEFWNRLSHDEQVLAFCAVVSKLKKAELDERRSYRGVLYSEFGFDESSYLLAQMSGFLELHNAISTDES